MENRRRKARNVRSVCLIVLLAFVAINGMATAQTQKVRISFSSRSNTSVPYYVAVSKGFFRDEGMDVEIIQANPRLGVMALMNGDVSFTGT
ncbi:MAG: ABC transporter substrate-binding protein, partial [Candidatus Binatia bacterium]